MNAAAASPYLYDKRREVSGFISGHQKTYTELIHTISMARQVYNVAFIGTVRIVCGAGSMKRYGARSSVRLSVPFVRCNSVRRVCCCGLGGHKILIEFWTTGAAARHTYTSG